MFQTPVIRPNEYLTRVRRASGTEFCDLEIPAAEFMPEKLVDLAGGLLKASLFQGTTGGTDNTLDATQTPPIRQIEGATLKV
jgi:hypothetical protein